MDYIYLRGPKRFENWIMKNIDYIFPKINFLQIVSWLFPQSIFLNAEIIKMWVSEYGVITTISCGHP